MPSSAAPEQRLEHLDVGLHGLPRRICRQHLENQQSHSLARRISNKTAWALTACDLLPTLSWVQRLTMWSKQQLVKAIVFSSGQHFLEGEGASVASGAEYENRLHMHEIA